MRNLVLLVSLVVFMISCNTSTVEISEWRGKNRLGVFDESNLMKSWPEDGPEELWYIDDLGGGYGSPTFSGERFYITGGFDSLSYLMCYDLQGNQKWKTQIGTEWMKSYPGSRSGPTVAGEFVYVVNGKGNFYCLESKTGKVLWSKDFENDFEGIPTMHGFSEAPVIDGDKVFWVPGGKKYNVVAFNRFNGDLIWSSEGAGERSGYNQGTLITLPARNIFVTFSAYHLMGFDTETGAMLWTQEQDNLKAEERILGMGDTHCNTVIYDAGYIYYSAGDGNCGVKLSLSEDGSEINEVWRNKEFDGYMGGILKIGNYLYGTSGSKPELRSFNAKTGETTGKYRLGSGALIAADNMMYYYEQRGILRLLQYDDGNINEVSSFRIERGNKEHFAHPVINDGILYQRHGKVLMAFDIKSSDKRITD